MDTLIPDPSPFGMITQVTGWIPSARVRESDSLGNAVSFDAATLTITQGGEAVYGPAPGTSAPDAGGFHVITWPDAGSLAAGRYAFSMQRTISGANQPPVQGTLALSPPALPAPPPPPVYPVSLAGIKAKLVGLDSWLAAAARQQTPYDDARILANIPAVLRKFERETTVQLRATQVITRDDGTYTKPDPNNPSQVVALNGLPIYKEEAYTYYPQSAFDYFITSLKTRPVQQIQRCRILFGNATVLALPPEWYEVDTQSGAFQILPVQGSLLFAEYSSSFALLQQSFQNRNFIPHVVHFDYVAGLPLGWENDYNNADLVRLLEEYCALAVLNDIAYLADAGLTGKSISGGGAGESYQYDRFMQRKAELQKNVDNFKMLWKDQNSPVMMMGA